MKSCSNDSCSNATPNREHENTRQLDEIAIKIAEATTNILEQFKENGILVRVENDRRTTSFIHLGSRENKLVDGQPIPTTLIKEGLHVAIYGDMTRSNDWGNYWAVIYGSPNNDNDQSFKVLAANKKDFRSDFYTDLFSEKDFLNQLNEANTH